MILSVSFRTSKVWKMMGRAAPLAHILSLDFSCKWQAAFLWKFKQAWKTSRITKRRIASRERLVEKQVGQYLTSGIQILPSS
jgi:hypothetical protein